MSAHQEIFFMPTQAFVSIIGIRDPEKSKGKDLSSRKLITRSLIQKRIISRDNQTEGFKVMPMEGIQKKK